MKPIEIRELSAEEIEKKIEDFKSEIFNLKFQIATGQIEDPTRIRKLKRDVARAKTILNEMRADSARKSEE